MKILISPAKLMNVQPEKEIINRTTPQFLKYSIQLHAALKKKSPRELAEMMKISAKLADDNWERNQKWTATPNPTESAPALQAFTGEVYRGLEASTLSEAAVHYLQQHLRILSGLYGLLRPSDEVMLYRLEMGKKLETADANNLYQFWDNKLTEALQKELVADDFVLNLASNEYIKAIQRDKLKCPVIDFEFYNYKGGELKNIVVYTKHARGMMVRHCAENKVQTLDEVKQFQAENYFFDAKLSTDTKLVFVR